MEELHHTDIEDVLDELSKDHGTEESFPPEVEELLRDLQSGRPYLVREHAAKQLEDLGISGARIVRALIGAYESDSHAEVVRAAQQSLRAPVHQDYLQQHPDLMEATESALRQPPGSDPGLHQTARALSPTETYAKMLKETRLWGLWSLALGVLHLILSGLSGPWGLVLITVGLASFVFRETAMFVVYSTILAWVAIANMLTGRVEWIVFSVLQLILAVVVCRQYTGFRRAEKVLGNLPGPQRASRAFPQIGCALGALALGALVTVFAGAVVLAVTETTGPDALLMWLEDLAIGLAVLGLAAAVSSLLSGYRYKPLSILGLVASALVLLSEIALVLFA